jgi:integrase/recombinase XerD
VLRHSFSSNLLAKGASVVSIQKLLGHSSLAVTTRYLHQDKKTLSEAVNLL